ncbi:hypothetical protein SARC_15480, partial [Sphaeroforma arctica JP610]
MPEAQARHGHHTTHILHHSSKVKHTYKMEQDHVGSDLLSPNHLPNPLSTGSLHRRDSTGAPDELLSSDTVVVEGAVARRRDLVKAVWARNYFILGGM